MAETSRRDAAEAFRLAPSLEANSVNATSWKLKTVLNIINHQQMHLRIIKKVQYSPRNAPICFGTVWCHPQGALSSWLKLHTIMA
jgi:hypothetical protein